MAVTPTRTGWWTRNTLPWGDRSVIVLAPPAAATAVAPAPATTVGMPAIPAAVATAVAPAPAVAVAPPAPPATATAVAPSPATMVAVTAPPAVAEATAPAPGALTGNDVVLPAPPAVASATAPVPAVTVTAPAPVATATAEAPAPTTAVSLPATPSAFANAIAPAPTATAVNHISPVSQAYAAADTVAMPAHRPGDTIIVFVSRNASGTPALQTGWTNIANGNRAVGTGNWSARIAYKVATSSAETVGTWTNAEAIIVLVYRGVTAIGVATTGSGAANKTITYPAATLQATNGQSWVIRFAHGGGAASTTADLTTNPVPGWVQRAGSAGDALTWDKGAPVTANPTADTQVTNNTNYWFAATVELRSAD